MRRCFILAAALVLGACGDEAFGTRGACASGGAINECPDFPHTAEGACEKLVACGIIVRDDPDRRDWGDCVDEIQRGRDDGTDGFAVSCILATSCDELATDYCFRFGDNN